MTLILKDKDQLVIPPSIRRRAGLKAGDRLEFKVSAGVITIAALEPARYKPTKAEWTAIRQGEAALEGGDSVPLTKFLHGLDNPRRKAGTKRGRKLSR